MTLEANRPPGLLDPKGVSELTGLAITTIHMYRSRGVLPDPDFQLGGGPVWKQATIERWNKRRLISQIPKPKT